MKVLAEMFTFICSSIEIVPPFLNLVMGFGRKTSSADENFMTCYNRFSFGDDRRSEVVSYGKGHKYSNQLWLTFSQICATTYGSLSCTEGS
jgi:hypothetical protein